MAPPKSFYTEAHRVLDTRRHLTLAQLRAGGVRVRCPKCQWEPGPQVTVGCGLHNCHARFNPFDTQGRCPACGTQWRLTLCQFCLRAIPHADWYRAAGSPSIVRA